MTMGSGTGDGWTRSTLKLVAKWVVKFQDDNETTEVLLPDYIITTFPHMLCYRRVRIKCPGFGDNRTPLNRGVGARCTLRLLRHVVSLDGVN